METGCLCADVHTPSAAARPGVQVPVATGWLQLLGLGTRRPFVPLKPSLFQSSEGGQVETFQRHLVGRWGRCTTSLQVTGSCDLWAEKGQRGREACHPAQGAI